MTEDRDAVWILMKRRGNAGSGSPFQTPIGGFDIVYDVHDGNPPPPLPTTPIILRSQVSRELC